MALGSHTVATPHPRASLLREHRRIRAAVDRFEQGEGINCRSALRMNLKVQVRGARVASRSVVSDDLSRAHAHSRGDSGAKPSRCE